MARLFYIAAQEIKQIIVNLGARPRNGGALGGSGVFYCCARNQTNNFKSWGRAQKWKSLGAALVVFYCCARNHTRYLKILGQSPEMEEPRMAPGWRDVC